MSEQKEQQNNFANFNQGRGEPFGKPPEGKPNPKEKPKPPKETKPAKKELKKVTEEEKETGTMQFPTEVTETTEDYNQFLKGWFRQFEKKVIN